MRDSSIKYLVSINTELIKKNLDDIYLKNFDNNIASVKTKSVLTNDATSTVFGTKKTISVANYDYKNNKLFLYPNNLERVKAIYNDDKMSSMMIYHELIKLAATDLSAESTGVNNKEASYDALNAGITEFFTYSAYSNANVIQSRYLFELLLTIQLITIVGEKHIALSYFNFHNIDTIKVVLSRYISEDKVDEFICLFEEFYNNRKNNNDYSLLGRLQISLADAFIAKCNMLDLSQNVVDYYKQYLITPELVNKYTNKDNDIPLLKESLNRFNNMEGKRSI